MLVDSHAHLDMVPADELPASSPAPSPPRSAPSSPSASATAPTRCTARSKSPKPPNRPRSPTIYASAGIHPQEAARHARALDHLASLAEHPRCIAIGEIGLDYYHLDNPTPDIQQAAFIAQTPDRRRTAQSPSSSTAEPPNSPHRRPRRNSAPADAWEDLLALLTRHWALDASGDPASGIMHCFSGNLDQATRSLSLGFYLSFAGNLTYPAARTIREVAAFAPADRILVETDAPFLAPIPHRGQRNEPASSPSPPPPSPNSARHPRRNLRPHYRQLPLSLPNNQKLITKNRLILSFMATDNSFDVVSKVDLQEVKNAIDQASKEVHTRFDLKDSKSTIALEGDETIQLASASEYTLKAVIEILSQRMVNAASPSKTSNTRRSSPPPTPPSARRSSSSRASTPTPPKRSSP